jgi:hypothetical protein
MRLYTGVLGWPRPGQAYWAIRVIVALGDDVYYLRVSYSGSAKKYRTRVLDPSAQPQLAATRLVCRTPYFGVRQENQRGADPILLAAEACGNMLLPILDLHILFYTPRSI